MKFRNSTTLKAGFTLIELLIVITIIGILALAFAQTVPGILARARDTARREAVTTIVQAVETYNNDNQGYPAGPMCFGKDDPASMKAYFSGQKAPKDPQVGTNKFDDCGSPGEYLYCKLQSPLNYFVAAVMEVKGDGTHKKANVNANACDGTGSEPDAGKPDTDVNSAYVVIK